MAQLLSRSKPKARKEHRCSLCNGIIVRGEQYENQTCVDGGDLYTFKMHDDCESLINLIGMDCDGEGINSDIFYEEISEYSVYYNMGIDLSSKTLSVHELSKKVYEHKLNNI
jgi:hypothetical protein